MRTLCSLIVLLCVGSISPAFSDENPSTSTQNMAAYNDLIMAEVQKSDAAAQSAIDQMKRSPLMSTDEIARLNALSTTAQVKHTIAHTFLNSPSMNSSVVRNAFLTLMQQDVITKTDLVTFQTLVDSEKAKMSSATPITQ